RETDARNSSNTATDNLFVNPPTDLAASTIPGPQPEPAPQPLAPPVGSVTATMTAALTATANNGDGKADPGDTINYTVTLGNTTGADVNGPDSFTVKVNDGTGDSNEVGTVSVTVVGVNDAPCFSATPSPCVPALPGAQTFNEDTPRVFNTAGSNRIRVSDVDSGAGNVTLTASVLHGTLNVSTAGVSVTGNNTAAISVVGTVANIDT